MPKSLACTAEISRDVVNVNSGTSKRVFLDLQDIDPSPKAERPPHVSFDLDQLEDAQART